MGSRAARARKGAPPNPRAVPVSVAKPKDRDDKPNIPDLTRLDVVFGNIEHLPPYDQIPERFRIRSSDPYCRFISGWFFAGRTADDMKKLRERPGVDRGKALAAIKAILASFAPKHEHKEAGCAFLLHEWFELDGAP